MPSSVIFGKHPIRELLKAGRRKVYSITYAFGSEQKIGEILQLARKKGIRLKEADQRQLSRMTEDGNHQGVVAEVAPPQIYDFKTFVERIISQNEKPVVAVLDSIMDPHNFGAILRSAETFGVNGIIFPKDRSTDINSTVVKTSAGASEYLDFCRVTNLARSISELRKSGFHVVASEDDNGIDISKFNPLYPLAVVLGSEGTGVRPLVVKNCDESITVPLKGKVGSLNVSAAAAIIFHEVSRKRDL